MPLFRGSKNATIVNGEIVATAQDIADAVNDAIAAKNAAEAAESGAQTAETNAETAETNAETAEANAETAESGAVDAQNYAEEWANKPEDSLVSTDAGGDGVDDFSALHHANKASDSASAASTSESNALTSEQNAQQAATDAETALDTFTDQYLGAKSSDPTTDNDGDPLQDGALYFNNTDGNLRIYSDSLSDWVVVDIRSDSEILNLFSAGGDLSYNSSTGEFSVTTYKSTDFDTDFASKSTDNLTEGTNLYYTDARVESYLSGGTGVDFSSGVISIGQPVGTGDSVSFVDAEFTGTGAVELPEGTEGQRPDTPAAGMIRFNSDVSIFEGYNGSEWGEIGGDLAKVLKPSGVSPTGTLPTSSDSETPTLEGSFYYHLGDVSHASSQFQVSTSDTDFDSNIVYDSGTISATLTHQVPAGNLTESTTFYFRIKYIDANGLESEFSDPVEFSTDLFFDYADPANIGTSINGGFLVGVIDTVAGTIDSQDDYQTGERYALIVAPKSLETGPGPKWDSQDRTGEAGSFTRWDGLSSTDSILAKNDTSYEAFEHIRSIRSSDPVPSDGGSDWYLPAMDELELIYRNLKPVTANNDTGNDTRAFPGSQDSGFNPSSDPTGSAYTATGEPFQTSVTDFQDGDAEALDLKRYWSSTDGDENGRAWSQNFTNLDEGRQNARFKDRSDANVRPVRRVPV